MKFFHQNVLERIFSIHNIHMLKASESDIGKGKMKVETVKSQETRADMT